MIDFARMLVPRLAKDDDGREWLCLHYVGLTADDTGELYIACGSDSVLPAACHLVRIPRVTR